MKRPPGRYTRCVCDWPKRSMSPVLCNGTGVQHCEGCGGDQCICVCGGERPCDGCDACDVAAGGNPIRSTP